MYPTLRSHADDFLQKDTWSESRLSNLPPDTIEKYNLCSSFQNTFDLAFSDTTHTTPLPVHNYADQVKKYDLPIRDTCDSTPTYTPASSSGQELTSFPDEDSSQQGTTATNDWSQLYAVADTDKGGLSPAADFEARNMIVHMNGDVGHRRTNSPSQVVKVNGYPDLTSNWTWARQWESPNKECLENTWLSKWKRLPIEPRNEACGWHCPICNQRLKRRDYIKPHVKRKHPERYGGLYRKSSSNPDQSTAPPADFPSTHDGILDSGLLSIEGRPRPVFSWDPQLEVQRPNPFQSHLTSLRGSITPQKRSLDSTSPDGRDNLDGSENESFSRFKTSHDSWARSLACPFYKHYPFQHRKCLALSLRRPKDVKQHIYRSHTKPEFYCARCYQIFHSATERDTHWRERLCDRLDGPSLLQFQGITEDQRKLLNEKSPRDLDAEAQWFQIYGIIFPGSEFPRSAYVGNCFEEMVPLLREKWEKQGYNITARTVGGLGHHQLSFAMDLFFRSLEGEALEDETDNSSICAVTTQSQMGDLSQRCTWSVSSA